MRIAALVAALGFAATSSTFGRHAPAPPAARVVLPFESVDGLIVLTARIGDSPPLSFILDTGAGPGIIDIVRARALGLHVSGSVNINGTGSTSTVTGAMIEGVSVVLDGLPSAPQPVTIAMPLSDISHKVGRRLDGILGGSFIRSFVVEINPAVHTVTLHDPKNFSYHGAGGKTPLTFDSNGHPVVAVMITPGAAKPIAARVKLDLGGTGSLTLHTPFVRAHGLSTDDASTTRSMGSSGLGGRSAGRATHMASLSFAGFTLVDVPTVLSADTGGAYASSELDGHMGERIASRFTILLDYGRKMAMFEPGAGLSDTFDRPSAGIGLDADGDDFRTFRVIDVLEHGASADAGIQIGDVLMSIDGRAAPTLQLSDIVARFERASPCVLVVTRAGQSVTVTLLPRVGGR